MIELKHVNFSYVGQRAAIHDVSLQVESGDIFTIIGSNGSGKSTLLQLMGGLLFPVRGEILFHGENITENGLKDQTFNRSFRSRIGFVFQNPDSQLFCPTVLDELLFAPLQIGIQEKIARQRASEVMKMLAITSLSDRPTYMLSGGEKKRVAIGSVLTVNPEVLLLDEPVSGLDPKTRSFLIELIFRLNEAGKTIIITTHNLELVDHFQSRVAVLSENHTLERIGTSDEILNDIEFLGRMNLISDQIHRHGDKVHTHIPKGLSHKH
jgi:cobalt/nickel transport system ATP-binding protein